MQISAAERVDGQTGGHIPDGKPRLFDTSQSEDNAGYGISGLAGDFSNVLIIQRTSDSAQWKANELGGVIMFELASKVDGC